MKKYEPDVEEYMLLLWYIVAARYIPLLLLVIADQKLLGAGVSVHLLPPAMMKFNNFIEIV